MRKLLFILPMIAMLVVMPAYAKDHGHGNNGDNDRNDRVLGVATTVSPSPSGSATPNQTPASSCNPSEERENHGAFVSCVAHQHLGGKVVSEIAQSDIGKHHQDNDGDEDDSTPSASPTISPTPTSSPTATPTLTPSPTASSSASPSAETTVTFNAAGLQSLVNVLQGIIDSLKGLL